MRTSSVTRAGRPRDGKRYRRPCTGRSGAKPSAGARAVGGFLTTLALLGLGTVPAVATPAPTTAPTAAVSSSATVWLCRPGAPSDPCTASGTAAVVSASGTSVPVLRASASPNASKFDCFYVYPTVSLETSLNADLTIQQTETDVAVEQASRFSQVCRVWAPMYRQVTWAGLKESLNPLVGVVGDTTAYRSIRAGFEAYLSQYNDGRPIVFIGHSQGAAMLILLLSHLVDNTPALRDRLVLAIILGGNVEVPMGKDVGGSFSHIPACDAAAEAGCVIAYSSFPGEPPAASVFGRPGQGVSLQSGQTAKAGLQVVCVNPADIAGGSAELDSYFRSEGRYPAPWVEYPGLYRASCESGGGATWLQVTKATGSSDHRPVVTEVLGPNWGYHVDDVNLALGNLVDDVAAAETTWLKR
jgi:hypothetical protein